MSQLSVCYFTLRLLRQLSGRLLLFRLLDQCLGDAETNLITSEVPLRKVSVSGAKFFCWSAPGSATDDTIGANAINPGTTVDGRALIAFMPTVFHPFPDISSHVVKTPWG